MEPIHDQMHNVLEYAIPQDFSHPNTRPERTGGYFYKGKFNPPTYTADQSKPKVKRYIATLALTLLLITLLCILRPRPKQHLALSF